MKMIIKIKFNLLGSKIIWKSLWLWLSNSNHVFPFQNLSPSIATLENGFRLWLKVVICEKKMLKRWIVYYQGVTLHIF